MDVINVRDEAVHPKCHDHEQDMESGTKLLLAWQNLGRLFSRVSSFFHSSIP